MSFATTARLLKSATFRLTLIYMVLFGVSGAVLLGFLWQATVGALSEQTSETILADIKGLTEQYERRGVVGVAEIVADRVRRDPGGRTVYLLTDPQGRRLVGNLGAWPGSEPDRDGWMTFELIDRDSLDGSPYLARARLFALQGGLRLLVGRDIRELEQTRSMIRNATIWGSGIAIVLSLAGGIAMSRSAARRIETINQTSREIMTGDLSRRIPVRGSGDDFDQLAGNLNDMLDRIQALMEGLRHVSDNIAHDLRTPLARLRGRIEDLDDESLPSGDRKRLAREAAAEADTLLRSDTPGARRPRARKTIMSLMRVCPGSAAGGVNGGTTNGIQNSPSGFGNQNPSDSTPTTVYGPPSRSTAAPTMPGSDAKRLVQARWLSSTTRSAPSRASSSVKRRPTWGVVRSRGNSAGETAAPRKVTEPSGPAHSADCSR